MPEKLLPREKLIHYGEERLNDYELIAIILRSGARGYDVFSISKEIFEEYKTFPNLYKASLDDLTKIKGLGKIGAINLKAALEMGKRYHIQKMREKYIKIKCPEDIYCNCQDMIYFNTEVIRIIYLNTKLEIIDMEDICSGTANLSIAHPRDIFRKAILNNSVSIILIHNHPSGDPNPSMQDIDLTNQLYKASDIIGIKLNDHIIIGKNSFYSFSLSKVVNLNE